MERVKEGNWILYIDSSKNEEGRVRSRWVLYGETMQKKEGMGKLVTVWEEEIKGVVEVLAA